MTSVARVSRRSLVAGLAGLAAPVVFKRAQGQTALAGPPSKPAANSSAALAPHEVDLDAFEALVSGNDWTDALLAALATKKSIAVRWRMAPRDLKPNVVALAKDQHIIGDGEGCHFRLKSTGVMISVDRNSGAVVRGLILEGPGEIRPISQSYLECGVRARNVVGLIVEQCKFVAWAGGAVFVQDGTECRVIQNTFQSARCVASPDGPFGTSDITLWGSSVRCIVAENNCVSGASYGVVIQTVNGAAQTAMANVIRDNVIEDAKNYAILVYNIDSQAHRIDDTKVTGNVCRRIYGHYRNPATGHQDFGAGIYILQAEGTEVSGNTVISSCIETVGSTLTPAGIAINATSRALVSNNQVSGSAWYGIYVVDTLQLGRGSFSGSVRFVPEGRVVVTDNRIDTCRLHGIYIRDKHNINCRANTITAVQGKNQSGIAVERTRDTYPALLDLQINGNRVDRSAGYGISTAGTLAANISGNHIQNTSVSAMVVGGARSQVAGNIIANCGERGIDLRAEGSESTLEHNSVEGCKVGILAEHRADLTANTLLRNQRNLIGKMAPP